MNPPKMPIHIGDFLRDTGHLAASGVGAYVLMLFHHWSTGELPDDDEQLMRIARLTKAEWSKLKPILAKFFGPGWHHGRVEEDLAKARESYEKRAKAGAQGGKAKAGGKQSSSIATAELEQSDSNALPTLDLKPDTKDISSLRSDSAPAAPKRARSTKARTQLPELWQPDEQDETYAACKGFSSDRLRQLSGAFANHHRGRGNLMADWHAAWRTWVDNEIKFSGGRNGQRSDHPTANESRSTAILAGVAAAAERRFGGSGQSAVPAGAGTPGELDLEPGRGG